MCIKTNSVDECTYEVTAESQNRPTNPRFSYWKSPNPPNPMDATSQERQAVGSVAQLAPILTPGATSSRLGPILAAPPERALIHPLGRNFPPRPSESRPQVLNPVRTRGPTLPSFSVLSTLVFPGIPPEPRLTLSSLGADRFQLSDVIISELDTKLYVFLICSLLIELIISP